MERGTTTDASLWTRWKLAFSILFDGGLARRVIAGLAAVKDAAAKPQAALPERTHASGLALLGALQREGRFIDFLQQDVTAFSDEEVGTAARVVHAGCRRWIRQTLDLEPAMKDPEGASIVVPAGFDARRLRLTGNVAGQPPFRGILKHHGWLAAAVRLPEVSDALDPRVIAPAEVELP